MAQNLRAVLTRKIQNRLDKGRLHFIVLIGLSGSAQLRPYVEIIRELRGIAKLDYFLLLAPSVRVLSTRAASCRWRYRNRRAIVSVNDNVMTWTDNMGDLLSTKSAKMLTSWMKKATDKRCA